MEKFSALGFDLYVTECRYGLAWLHMLQGDYHRALTELDTCEEQYRTAAQPKGTMLCQLDRAEALLSLNLFRDALRAAKDAERKARKLGIHYESAKAAFFVGQAALVLGDHGRAREAFERAERGFSREHNRAFAAAVHLFAYPAQQVDRLKPSRLRAMRREFARAQLPLWEAICDLQLLQLLPDQGRVARRLEHNPAVQVVPHLYSLWQTHLGDRAAQGGRLDDAARHWEQAAERLEAVRAKLPPVEMRSTFMRRRSDPYLRLIAENIGPNPAHAAVWSERYKTSGVWALPDDDIQAHPARARARQSLAELACQVSALCEPSARTGGRRSSAAPAIRQRFGRLQQQVRGDLSRLESTTGGTVDRFEALMDDIHRVSCRQPIVQFHFDQADLVAFIHEDGRTRTHRYPGGRHRSREFAGCWNVLLGRGLLATGQPRSSDLREERRFFAAIGDWLWAPLELSSSEERVLIVPEGRLWNVPWLAIQHDGLPVAARHAVILTPSIRHHRHAARRPGQVRNIEVFVGRTNGLSHARPELAALEPNGSGSVAVFDPCRRDDWPSDGNAWIWHYTGHAQFRADNPFYSSLLLDDGPLFAADFRLKRAKVDLVTLAACRTGYQPILPGEESTGLVRSLLEMGGRNVVGSHWTVSDASTSQWVKIFYRSIFEGQSVSEAVRFTALTLRETLPSAYDWAAFSVFGAG